MQQLFDFSQSKPEKIFWGIVAVALLYVLLGTPGADRRSAVLAESGPAGVEALPTGSCHTGGGGCGCGGGVPLQ